MRKFHIIKDSSIVVRKSPTPRIYDQVYLLGRKGRLRYKCGGKGCCKCIEVCEVKAIFIRLCKVRTTRGGSSVG
jgi:hypothetical protein